MTVRRLLKDADGFGILEALIGVTLVALVGASSVAMLGYFGKNMVKLSNQHRRDNLQLDIYDAVSDPVNLNAAIDLPGNESFKKCLRTNAVDGGGLDCTPGPFPLRVVTPAGDLVTGSISSPVYYDLNGKNCSAGGDTCPMKATSQFVAICPAPGAPCEQAVAVTIMTLLEPYTQS